jgi:hypothetical protein
MNALANNLGCFAQLELSGREKGRRDQEPYDQKDRPISLCLPVLLSMTSKDEVTAAKAAAEAARAELNAHWGSFFDEEGQFEATFGDPKKTPCAYTHFPPFHRIHPPRRS